MKPLVILDLKGTIVYQNQLLDPSFVQVMQACQKLQADLVLYSIAECWTYEVLAKYKQVFDKFAYILLVKEKKKQDLQWLGKLYQTIFVIGDSLKDEVTIGNSLGYKTILINDNDAQKGRNPQAVAKDIKQAFELIKEQI
jgi:FMN phosphatase YigB (HAD superfamily)